MTKIYVHFSTNSFSNGYILLSEETKNAVLVDPGSVTTKMIHQMEDHDCIPQAILITHNHDSHVAGIKTLRKIYNIPIYTSDHEINGIMTASIFGDGFIDIPPYHIEYFSIPGHSPDSMVFKIGNILFTGDTMTAGLIGSTPSRNSTKLLRTLIETKILSQKDDLYLLPGHGPPSTLSAERQFNIELQGKVSRKMKPRTYF